MKNIYKKVTLVILVMTIIILLATNTFAAIDINNIKDNDVNVSGNEIATIGSYIYTGITNVGIILAVVVIAILGVKYMMGSAEEKAEYKKSMMPYLIGALLVFGASGIAKVVVSLAS